MNGYEESFKYYEFFHFSCTSLHSSVTPAKGHHVKFEIWFKKNNEITFYLLELPNDSFDLRAKNALNFFKDLRSFLEGNSAMWWGKKPFESENFYKLELKNDYYKQLTMMLRANHREHKESKLYFKEGEVDFSNLALLRDLIEQ